MYERPTGNPSEDKNFGMSKKFPEGYDPTAMAGSYHVPNSFSRKERITNSIIGLLLFAYGTYGVWQNDIWLPGKRTSGIHFHGIAAWFCYGAILAGVAMLLCIVVDHYDKRKNEHKYAAFKQKSGQIGTTLFIGAIVWHLYEAFTK